MKAKQGIIIYTSDDGNTSVSLMTRDGNVWLNQNQLGELFDTSIPNISIHISNILKEKELDENSVIKDYLTTAKDFSVVRQEATCKDFLHVQMRAESLATNGVRTFQSASMALTGGLESPPSVRAESPIGNSVGQSPTSTAQKMFKPCKGVGKRMSPLQGLQWGGARNVGLHPTLLPTPFQGCF